MPFTAAGAATAFGLMLGITDFIFGRVEAADTTRRLEEIDARLDDLASSIADISTQILNSEVGAVTAARNALSNFPSGEALVDATVRANERRDIVTAADEALQRIIAQVDGTFTADRTLEEIAVRISAVSYAMLTRMQVAAELEAGPHGARGIRDALEKVLSIHADAEQALGGYVRRDITTYVEQEAIPTGVFTGAGVLRIGTVGTELGGLSTERIRTEGLQEYLQLVNNLDSDPRVAAIIARRAAITEDLNLPKVGQPTLLEARGEFENLFLGEDRIGGAGDDRLDGSTSVGQFGSDLLLGNGGNDILRGFAGDDSMRGDAGDDALFADEGQDFLTGGPGDDVLDGGAGLDIARYFGLATDYAIEGGSVRATVTGPEGTDILNGIETILFDDGALELEEVATPALLGGAKRTALLYEAALDRDGDIDTEGLNFWIAAGSSLSERDIAFHFLESPEFQDSFGDYTRLGARDLVETLYRNVLNREGEAAGVTFWTGVYESPGYDAADLLLDFSVSPENLAGTPFIDRLMQMDGGVWDFV